MFASLLHDLGLSEEYAADNASKWTRRCREQIFCTLTAIPKVKNRHRLDAICLHGTADIAERREPEVALVHFVPMSMSWGFV